MTWRQRLTPLIRETLLITQHKPYRERRKALRIMWDDTGLGDRRCWPYKVWLDEIRVQMGHKRKRKGLKQCEAQRRLFD